MHYFENYKLSFSTPLLILVFLIPKQIISFCLMAGPDYISWFWRIKHSSFIHGRCYKRNSQSMSCPWRERFLSFNCWYFGQFTKAYIYWYINIFSYNRVILWFFFPSENVAGAPIWNNKDLHITTLLMDESHY